MSLLLAPRPIRPLLGPVATAVTIAAVLALAGCGGGSGAPPAEGSSERAWNVLLVTFDTTRADRIGCYGNERIETPAIDRLAAEGIRFANAMSAVPITAPSHTTIMTGRYPIAHGVRDNGLFVLSGEEKTLAERLREQGYRTAAAVGAFPVTSQFGLDQGFESFDDHLTGAYEDFLGHRTVPKDNLFFDERRAAQVNEALLPWLDEHATENADAPFFAWAHYFDPHQPFEPPPPYDQLYADDLYNGEIAYADSRLGFLLQHLEKLGVLDDTLVIMTADHGEGLGEHDEVTHAVLAYNSTLHVPLVIRPPASAAAPAGHVVEQRVGTVDIVPTVLELLGLPRTEDLQGRSLVGLWQEEAAPAPARRYAENLSPRLTHGWGELRVLYDGPLKYIHGPRPELYDLEADPDELRDLAADRPEEAERLRDVLAGFIERNSVEGASTTTELDEETRRRLESLGYLHGSGTAGETIVERLTEEGAPPQDRVDGINDLSAAKHLLFDGRYAEALTYTEKLLAHSPESPLYLELHASGLLELGRLDEAERMMTRLGELGSVPRNLVLRLAALRFEHGEQEPAITALRARLADSPSEQGYWLLATLLDRLGETEASRLALEEALELRPDYAPARVDLAVHHARAGELEAAEASFERAFEDSPYYPKTYYNYGTFMLQYGRAGEAASAYERAIALSPRYLKARIGLIGALLTAGERQRAEAAFETLRTLAPASQEAKTAAAWFAS